AQAFVTRQSLLAQHVESFFGTRLPNQFQQPASHGMALLRSKSFQQLRGELMRARQQPMESILSKLRIPFPHHRQAFAERRLSWSRHIVNCPLDGLEDKGAT